MPGELDDPLWPHFLPLWRKLESVPAKDMLVGGGYGLFLKQQWLLNDRNVATIVPIQNWRNATPRVTKDVDLVLGLDLIADEKSHELVLEALFENGFHVSEKDFQKRWAFIKTLSPQQRVIVELHAPRPSPTQVGIVATEMRVKHKPSLGEDGVHGRTNPEAAGSELHPFRFKQQGVELRVPNPVTWSVMKLTAMRDRWETSQNVGLQQESREFAQNQAQKHAQDVCRVIAMMTEDERDNVSEVVDSLSERPEFIQAKEIRTSYFGDQTNPAVTFAKSQWDPADNEILNEVLSDWFA